MRVRCPRASIRIRAPGGEDPDGAGAGASAREEGQTGAGAHAGTCARADPRARRGSPAGGPRCSRTHLASVTLVSALLPYHAARASVHAVTGRKGEHGSRERPPWPCSAPRGVLGGLAGKAAGGCGGGPGDAAGPGMRWRGPGRPRRAAAPHPDLSRSARLLVLSPPP